MKRLTVTLGAAAAWFLPGHIALLAVLLYVWASAMASTTNTAKTRAVEQRVNSLVTAVGTTNTNVANLTSAISGQDTGNAGLPDGTINGTSGGPNPWGTADTSGQIGGASAHYHTYNDLGGHTHPSGSYAVANGNHDHTLPVV